MAGVLLLFAGIGSGSPHPSVPRSADTPLTLCQARQARHSIQRERRVFGVAQSGEREDGRKQMKSILVASPVRQKPEILKRFLASLEALQSGGLELSIRFVDDNREEESRRLLREFAERHPRVDIVERDDSGDEYRKDEITHYWDAALMDKVGEMKDALIEHALRGQYDGLFLVDSDLVLHPGTIAELAGTGKEIISRIFWTKWHPDSVELPQVWMSDQYSFVPPGGNRSGEEKSKEAMSFLARLRSPGIHEVGGLGACTLIRRSALLKGVRFKRLPNLSLIGEDRHFCVRAAALGIPLYVDTRNPAFHIYRESDLEGADRYLAQHGKRFTEQEAEISLCMIVRDEEETLASCLSSVAGIADEIIIVDTGSMDRTKEIAQSFGAKVYDFEWVDDFSAARNYAFDKASKDFILWLDADDVIEERDREKFIQLKKAIPSDVDSIMMDYHLTFESDGTPSFSIKRNRLVRRSRGFRWIGAVHEYLDVQGRRLVSDIAITHRKVKPHTDRNLQIYRRRKENGQPFDPRDMYYFANELKDHAHFEEAIRQYEEFLDTGLGWVEDRIAACWKLSDCYAAMKDKAGRLKALLRSMELDKPRAECCCRLGALFMEENRFPPAIFWYELATRLGDPPDNGAMVERAAWTWLPWLQLCICYDRLGQHEKAYQCNEKALSILPGHPAMLANRQYFLSRHPHVANLAKKEQANG